MSYRGSPLNVIDYIKGMDEQLRRERANTGTTRVPSQRIGGFIVEVELDVVTEDPRIKLTEVATGIVTYCCIPAEDTDCFEVPPFSWYGVVDAPNEFPGYPVPKQITIVEAAVVMYSAPDALTIEIRSGQATPVQSFLAGGSFIGTYPIAPPITFFTNDVVSVAITDVGTGAAEDVVIVLRTCITVPVAPPS